MKKVIIVSVALVVFLVSCKKEQIEAKIPVAQEDEAVEETVSEECYLGIIKNDTVSLSLNIKGGQISSGELRYKFFEKDKNEGTLIGEIKGDTLFADYTFMSEGISSIRQVAFLKKGNTYIEGYGDIEENDGKSIFKNTKQLKFDGKIVLSKVDCL